MLNVYHGKSGMNVKNKSNFFFREVHMNLILRLRAFCTEKRGLKRLILLLPNTRHLLVNNTNVSLYKKFISKACLSSICASYGISIIIFFMTSFESSKRDYS
jgi:hypothetical protein